jgi:hypothetical protein
MEWGESLLKGKRGGKTTEQGLSDKSPLLIGNSERLIV